MDDELGIPEIVMAVAVVCGILFIIFYVAYAVFH